MNEPPTDPPKYFERREGYAIFAPVWTVSLREATDLVTRAIVFACDHQVERLLVDTTGLTGFPSPSVADRYWIVRQWANASKARVAVAVVLEPYMVDPERFGVKVGVNLGMRTDVFTANAEALEWLLSSRPSSVLPDPGRNP